MLRKIVVGVAVLLGLAGTAIAVLLALTHAGVRRERAPLPSREEVVASAAAGEHPVALGIANTASQGAPRAAVLDPALDPAPDEPYVMSHPGFVLAWSDGRRLLVDVGMDRAGALAFGGPVELVSGGAPIDPHASVAEQLGSDAMQVEGVIFTHLHSDHVGGVTELCRGRTRPFRVFMTEAQDQRPNHTTRPGRTLLAQVKRGAQGEGDPPCVEVVSLPSGGLQPVPGFPGVFVIAAGGHTPGSQIVLAHVDTGAGATTYAFTGDIVNHVAAIDHDIPKPTLYRILVVPESDERQAELRRFLKDLRDGGGVKLLISHDERMLDASGVPAYRSASSPINAKSSSTLGAGTVAPPNSR